MAEENSIITVNNTSYSIQDKWLETAKKYFGVDDDDEVGISLLKAGLFGYNNEIMSNEIKNNVYHRNILYDEHFLNTASIPKSIYNFAKVQNEQVTNAVPSQMRITFSVKKNDITNSSKFRKIESFENLADSDSAYEFIISNEYLFTLGDYRFMLPFPVQLIFRINNINNEYTVIARYMYEESEFPFLEIKNPYLKLWEDSFRGEKYLFIAMDIFQMEREETSIKIVSEDISENLFYNIDYKGQLAYFNVYYTYNGERELLKTYFNNTSTPPENEKYCYFTFIDDNRIELSFSALPNNFRPRFNSSIEVEVFTTSGANGNFSYSGEILVNFINDSEMNKLPVYITPLTDASGGKDKPSYLEIKQQLIENYLVRDNLITDYDLDLYFNRMGNETKINNSSIKFIKKRNDVIKRLWNAYLLLRNNEGHVIPTTTVPNLLLTNQELKDNNYTIPENTAVVYDIEADSYFCVYHKLELEDYRDKSKYLIYSLPYLIKIEQNPVLSSIFYKTHVNNVSSLSFKYLNPNIPYQFLVSNFDIARNNMSNETYTFALTLTTNLVDESFNENVKVRGILKSRSGEVYGYFDFNRISDTELMYEGYLATEKRNVINSNRMNIYNSLYSIDSSPILDNDGFTSVKNAYIDGEVDLEIVIMYNNKFSKEKFGESAKMPDMASYGTVCLLKNDEPIKLFSNLSNMIESNVFPVENGMNLKSVPLVEHSYFQYNYDLVYYLLDSFMETLSQNMDRLENNTSVDVKLYNTYGRSRWYYSNKSYNSISHKNEFDMVKRVDLDLKLTIHSNSVVTGDDDLAIKRYISDFIESCNAEGIFPMSNLIRRLEENFDIIRFIEFESINGLPIQKIQSKYTSFLDMDKQEVIDYVPEYLNLRKELIANTEEIGTEQYYNYAITINYI
jgi:hypothetical protein